jgi:hypothetical protein
VLLTFRKKTASIIMLDVRKTRVQPLPMYFDLDHINITFLLNVGDNPIHVASKPNTKFMCIFRSGCTVATNFWQNGQDCIHCLTMLCDSNYDYGRIQGFGGDT